MSMSTSHVCVGDTQVTDNTLRATPVLSDNRLQRSVGELTLVYYAGACIYCKVRQQRLHN